MVRYAKYHVQGGLRKLPKDKPIEENNFEAEGESEALLAAQAEAAPIVKKPKLKSKVAQFSLKGLNKYDDDDDRDIVPAQSSATGIAAELQKKAIEANKVKKAKKKKKINVTGEVEQELKKIKEANKGKLTAEEEKELEVYIKKDHRREERRLKRMDDRQTSKVCFNCREPGHTIADCPKMMKASENSMIAEHGMGVCFKCGSTEHKVDKCRVKLAPGEYPYATCFICNEKGHLSSQCVDNPRGLYPHGGCCGLCGSVEHYKKDCPEHLKAKGVPEIRLKTIKIGGSADDDMLDLKPAPVAKRKGPKIVKF